MPYRAGQATMTLQQEQIFRYLLFTWALSYSREEKSWESLVRLHLFSPVFYPVLLQ